MKSHSLTRRLLAGAAGLMIGATGAVAFATPAFAGGDGEAAITGSWKSFTVTGSAICDETTGDSTVEWKVTNTSWVDIDAEITNVVADGEIEGDLAVGTVLAKGAEATGTQVVPAGTESVSIEVELTWTWQEKKWAYVPPQFFWKKGHWKWQWVEKSKTKTETATLELTDCEVPPPPPPSIPPNVILIASCDDLVFIVDNVGDAEATVELAPNTTVSYGPASGFSYSLDENGLVEAIVDDDASIDFGDEADESNPVVIGPVAPGDDPVAVGFEGLAGLEITVTLTLNGEVVEFEDGDNIVSYDDEIADLDCDSGEGGELPVTGVSTGLIALGAVVLLAIGGGLFLVARRRRVTFTA